MDPLSCYALCDAGAPGGWLALLVAVAFAIYRERSWRGARKGWQQREHHLQSLIPAQRSEPTQRVVIQPLPPLPVEDSVCPACFGEPSRTGCATCGKTPTPSRR